MSQGLKALQGLAPADGPVTAGPSGTVCSAQLGVRPLIPKPCPQRPQFDSRCSRQSQASVTLTRSPATQSPSPVPKPPKQGPALTAITHRLNTRPDAQLHTHSPYFHHIPEMSRNSTLPELSPYPPPKPLGTATILWGWVVGNSVSLPVQRCLRRKSGARHYDLGAWPRGQREGHRGSLGQPHPWQLERTARLEQPGLGEGPALCSREDGRATPHHTSQALLQTDSTFGRPRASQSPALAYSLLPENGTKACDLISSKCFLRVCCRYLVQCCHV